MSLAGKLHFPLSILPSFCADTSMPSSSRNCRNRNRNGNIIPIRIICCSGSNYYSASSSSLIIPPAPPPPPPPLPVLKKRKRYRKLYPGESKGITEEMRFVTMRLSNINGKKYTDKTSETDSLDTTAQQSSSSSEDDLNDGERDTWVPSIDGFLKYLVDSKLVFNTVERIIDVSSDVSYAYFRNSGLERSEGLSKDLEWFRQEGHVLPEPSNPGVSYAKYLEELAERSAPLFLCHFYNIYFSHIAGGQVIARQVSKKLLEDRELEFYKWEGDVPELLKGVREKLNMLAEHWCRDDKNKGLKETTKTFRYMGEIVRLIILF